VSRDLINVEVIKMRDKKAMAMKTIYRDCNATGKQIIDIHP